MRKHVKLRPHVILDVNMHMKLDWNHSPERRFNDCQNIAAFWHLTWSCSSPELIDWADLKIDPVIFTLRSPWMYDILDNYHVLIQCGAGEKPVGIKPTKTCTCSRCVLDIAISFFDVMNWMSVTLEQACLDVLSVKNTRICRRIQATSRLVRTSKWGIYVHDHYATACVESLHNIMRVHGCNRSTSTNINAEC